MFLAFIGPALVFLSHCLVYTTPRFRQWQ